jgi:hypothetical protein
MAGNHDPDRLIGYRTCSSIGATEQGRARQGAFIASANTRIRFEPPMVPCPAAAACKRIPDLCREFFPTDAVHEFTHATLLNRSRTARL